MIDGTASTGMAPAIIYDFGANNGDDIPYYLKKADLVVAVEANPSLCQVIGERFAGEIAAGRLRVENCVLVSPGSPQEVHFYLHKRRHVLGQFPEPDPSVAHDYTRILLPSQSAVEVIRKHGDPYYIKIDIEGCEEAILTDLFHGGIRPPFISAESHSIVAFASLVSLGRYRAFKLVDGASVAKKYRNHPIAVNGASELYSFPPHSAGPFGGDIAGGWMNADDMFALLAAEGLGWKDIHATYTVEPAPVAKAQKRRYMLRHMGGWLSAKFRSKGEPSPR